MTVQMMPEEQDAALDALFADVEAQVGNGGTHGLEASPFGLEQVQGDSTTSIATAVRATMDAGG